MQQDFDREVLSRLPLAEAVLSLSARQRERFIRIFRELAENPFQQGEETFRDSLGREIQKRAFAGWLVSY